MNICIGSMVDLVEIMERTPNIEYLSVTFANHFNHMESVEKISRSTRFDSMTRKFYRLNKLNKVSFTTKNVKSTETNEYISFDQIEIFIERCCPNKTILKRITMKFYRIKYSKDILSTLNRYKHTFDRFDFYGSFIVDEEDFNSIEIPSEDGKFDYHIEGNVSSYPDGCYVHINSLPFTFNKLYGFQFI